MGTCLWLLVPRDMCWCCLKPGSLFRRLGVSTLAQARGRPLTVRPLSAQCLMGLAKPGVLLLGSFLVFLRGSGLKSCRTVREFLVAGTHRWLEMPGPASPDAPGCWVLLTFRLLFFLDNREGQVERHFLWRFFPHETVIFLYSRC